MEGGRGPQDPLRRATQHEAFTSGRSSRKEQAGASRREHDPSGSSDRLVPAQPFKDGAPHAGQPGRPGAGDLTTAVQPGRGSRPAAAAAAPGGCAAPSPPYVFLFSVLSRLSSVQTPEADPAQGATLSVLSVHSRSCRPRAGPTTVAQPAMAPRGHNHTACRRSTAFSLSSRPPQTPSRQMESDIQNGRGDTLRKQAAGQTPPELTSPRCGDGARRGLEKRRLSPEQPQSQ